MRPGSSRRRLPWMVFDYIDGAAGRETGAARNRAAFDDLPLRSRILRDVSQRDLTSSVFGKPTKAPFGISPMGMCNLSAPGADMMLARLAAEWRGLSASLAGLLSAEGTALFWQATLGGAVLTPTVPHRTRTRPPHRPC